jgi:transcriptional regulator with XRE-family HTH domain
MQFSCGASVALAAAGEEELRMVLSERLRSLRQEKNLSQGDIEKRTGLLRFYLSRVENGHTTPSIQTLEKLARALEVPLYEIFYDGKEPPALPGTSKRKARFISAWGSSGKEARTLDQFRRLLKRMKPGDREVLLSAAQEMAARARRRAKSKRALKKSA